MVGQCKVLGEAASQYLYGFSLFLNIIFTNTIFKSRGTERKIEIYVQFAFKNSKSPKFIVLQSALMKIQPVTTWDTNAM